MLDVVVEVEIEVEVELVDIEVVVEVEVEEVDVVVPSAVFSRARATKFASLNIANVPPVVDQRPLTV